MTSDAAGAVGDETSGGGTVGVGTVGAVERFVVCGEALIDLVPAADADTDGETGAGEHFASRWEAQSAGGPLNTAVALARLGCRVDFCAPLSTDAFGRQLAAHLAGSGVGTGLAPRSEAPTSLAVLSLRDGKASYHFHTAGTATFDIAADSLPTLSERDWLHVASLALIVEPGAGVLAAWACGHRGPISLDVNVRPAVIGDPTVYWHRLLPWLELVAGRGGVIKGSDEDFDFLAAGAGVADRDALWDELPSGPGAVCIVVTLGPDGAEALVGGTRHSVPGIARDVVDTVGAGDTFTAGFLRVYAARPDAVTEALTHGVAASAIVVTRRGAQPPTSTEVETLLSATRRPHAG